MVTKPKLVPSGNLVVGDYYLVKGVSFSFVLRNRQDLAEERASVADLA